MTRGQYIPPSHNDPQNLPDYWVFEDGTLRTDLPELSDAELAELGWIGPIQMPPLPGTSYFTHSYKWNKETLSFDAIELDQNQKIQRINYTLFWNFLTDGVPKNKENIQLTGGIAYKKIKTTASQSLLVNILFTEFIALLNDAKNKNVNEKKIQEVLLEIVENVPFTEEELEELRQALIQSGMFILYSLEPVK